MKFNALLSKQEEKVAERINENYGLTYYSPNIKYQEFNKQINLIIKKHKDAKLFKELIKTRTYFKIEELNKLFSTESLQSLKDFGFLMLLPKNSNYLVAEEIFKAILENNEKMLTYQNCTKDFLLTLVNPSLYSLPKYQLIEEIFKLKSAKLSAEILEEFYSFFEIIYPIKDILTIGVSIDEIIDFLKDNGYSKNDNYTYHFWEYQKEIIHDLKRLSSNLFKNKYIYYTNLNYQHVLVLLPDVFDQVTEYITEKRKKLKEEILTNINTYSDIIANTKYLELSHLDIRVFFRAYVFLQAFIIKNQLTVNQKGILKLSEVKAVAKIIAPWTSQKKLQAGNPAFELSCLLVQELVGIEHPPMSKIKKQEEQIKSIFSFQRLGRSLLAMIELSSKFPKNIWLDCEQIYEFSKLELISMGVSNIEISKEFFVKSLFYLQSYFSFLDLLYEEEVPKAIKGTFSSLPKAIRFLHEPKHILDGEYLNINNSNKTKEEIKISNNLEIALPLNLTFNQAVTLAKVYEIKNLYTLTINEKHIASLAKNYTTQEEFLAALQENINNDIPEIVKRMLSKVYKSREKIYLDTQFIYLYNPATLEVVLKLIPNKNGVVNIDNRVLAFRYNLNLEKFKEKLEQANFIVKGVLD